jgi:two-component system sensor histidine kinase RegB
VLQRSHRGVTAPGLPEPHLARRLGDRLRHYARALSGGGERRTRLRTLILIRWIGIVGQAFTICLVHFSLGFDLPLLPLLAAVGLSAAINLALGVASTPTTRLPERGVALLLGYDILQLALLLALTGGLQNPFSILLIVPVTLAAITLSLRTTMVLCATVIVAATLLGLLPSSLPWGGDGLRLPGIYRLAIWVALVMGNALIAGYAWRVADEARRLVDALGATQMALAREQRLSALGGLAAAAAHDLGSPLATIAVTARELANSIPADSPLFEDVAELVSESQRCREILKTLSQRPESDELAPFTRLPLSHWLGAIAEERRRPEVEVVVVVKDQGAPEPQLAPTPELRHAFANLIDNATRFANHRVAIEVDSGPETVEVRIADDGPGFPPEVLEFLGEPYLSSGHEGAGSGLGVFIAQTLLARTGATLHFGHANGACVAVRWRREALEVDAPET